MEWLSGLVAALLAVGAVGGVAVDEILTKQLRNQIQSAERLEVRVQSVPNYRLALGEIDRVRVAGRGVLLQPGFRVALVELESDPIKLDLNNLSHLAQPVKAAARVQLTEADLNIALNMPQILASLKGIRAELPSLSGGAAQLETFDLTQPQIQLTQGEIAISALLSVVGKTPPGQEIRFTIRTALGVDKGTKLQFLHPQFLLDGVEVPPDLGEIFSGALNTVINLDTLRQQGITGRILRLSLTPGQLELIGFAQIDRLPGS